MGLLSKKNLLTAILLLSFSVTGKISFGQNKYIDSVKALTSSSVDTIRFWAYSELAWELKDIDKESATKYSQNLIDEAFKIHNDKWYAQGLNDIGIIYFSSGELDKALSSYEASLAIRKKLGVKKDIASSLSKIAVILTEKAQYGKSLKIQLEALKIYEELDIKPYISQTCNNIAALYTNINNYELSNQYLQRAYKIENEIGDKAGLSITLASIGGNYSNMGNPDSAIDYINKAKVLLKEIGDFRSYTIACNNIGHIYRLAGNTKKGKENYLEAIEIATEIGDSSGLVLYLNNLANVLIDEGNLKEAESMLLKSYSAANRLGQGETSLKILSSLTALYIQMKNAEKADLYFARYRSAKDSIFSTEAARMYSEEQTKFDVAKKDLELKAQSEEIEKKNAERNLIIAALLFFVLIAAIALWAFIQKRKSNKQVELKNVQLEHANEEISHQKEELSEKQKEILDSINYAQRIQNALLANEEFLLNHSIDHFILFKPKDIVSGDFTWATKKDHLIYLACCDSTGHGVPGAFMSLLSMGFLSEAIKERDILEPGNIFNYVRERLIETIGKGHQKDGFDGILLCIDPVKKEISFAAANNNPLQVQDGQFIHLPTDKMPVGKGIRTDSFTTYKIDYKEDDTVFMFTDGYPDQFGGPKGKKLKYKPLEEMLLQNHKLPFSTQKEKLDAFFEEWKGNLEQVDDVCIIGIRL